MTQANAPEATHESVGASAAANGNAAQPSFYEKWGLVPTTEAVEKLITDWLDSTGDDAPRMIVYGKHNVSFKARTNGSKHVRHEAVNIGPMIASWFLLHSSDPRVSGSKVGVWSHVRYVFSHAPDVDKGRWVVPEAAWEAHKPGTEKPDTKVSLSRMGLAECETKLPPTERITIARAVIAAWQGVITEAEAEQTAAERAAAEAAAAAAAAKAEAEAAAAAEAAKQAALAAFVAQNAKAFEKFLAQQAAAEAAAATKPA